MKRHPLLLTLLLCAVASTAWSASPWDEASLSPAEAQGASGDNDGTPAYSTPYDSVIGVADINALSDPAVNNSGTGYISNSSDQDVYRFRVHAGDVNNPAHLNLLRIALNTPANAYYEFSYYAWNSGCGCWSPRGGMSGDASTPAVAYDDLSGITFGGQDYYVVVRAYNGQFNGASPYTLAIDMAPSGDLSGKVTAIGAGASGDVSFTVRTDLPGGGTLSTTADGSGNYTLHLPLNTAVSKVKAARYWYNGAPADWAYGISSLAISPAVSFSSGGQSSGGHDIVSYPEARLAGNIVGLSGSPSLGWSLTDPYAGGSGASDSANMEGLGGNNPYVLHNLEPGVYFVKVQPNDQSRPPFYLNKVVLTDGKTKTLNVAFANPTSISGSLVNGSGSQVSAYVAGHGNDDTYRIASTNVSAGSYSLSNLGPGNYDLYAGGNGPGSFTPLLNVGLAPDVNKTGQDFIAAAATATLSGSVADLQALGTADLGLLVMRSTDDPFDAVTGLAPMWFGQLSGTSSPYSFSVAVPASGSYDLALVSGMGGNGWPTFHTGVYGQAYNSSGIALTSTATGNLAMGALNISGKTLPELGLELWGRSGGANVLLLNGGRMASGSQVSSNGFYVLPNLAPGAYQVATRLRYLQAQQSGISVSSGPNLANLNLSVDPAQDPFPPYAHGLQPIAGSTVNACTVSFTAYLSDGIVGSGVNPASVSATVDGLPAAGLFYDSVSGWVGFGPGSALGDGTHTVWIGFADQAGTVHNSSVGWQVTINCSTPTPYAGSPTVSPTVTETPFQTETATVSATPTATETPYAGTPTYTLTPTQTSTYQWTEAGLSISECQSCSSSNNSTPSGSFGSSGGAVINPGGASSALGQGAGYLANGGDVDVLQFRIRASEINDAAGLNFLKVTAQSPANSYYSFDLQQYNALCPCWNGGGGLYGSNSTTFYRDLSGGTDQDFYLRINSNNGTDPAQPYVISIQVVSSATISGNVQLVGLRGSDSGQVQVSAWPFGGSSSNGLSWASTDASGHFSLHVPAGVAIGGLSATRQWYNGGPADWAYGPSDLAFNLPPTLPGNGSLGGQDFKAYPEAVLQGAYTGTGTSPSNWNWTFSSEYDRSSGGWVNVLGGVGSYAVHNARPGTYYLRVDPNDATNAPVVFDGVVITDGMITTRNFNFNAGASVSGSIAPVGSDLSVRVYETGFLRTSTLGQANGVSGSYNIDRLAPGEYDIEVSGNGGPSPYFLRSHVVLGLGANGGVSVSGTAQNATITGSVTDGLAVGFGNLAVVAVIHGSDPNSGSPVLAGGVDGSGNFTVLVDSAYPSWDLALINTNTSTNWPPFYDAVAGLAPGATSVSLSTQVGGHRVSGDLSVAGKPLAAYGNVFGGGGNLSALIFRAGGFRDGTTLDTSLSRYSSNPLADGSYSLRLSLPFTSLFSQSFTVAGSDVVHDASLSLDSARDIWAPSADQLEPAHYQVLVQSQPTLHCRLSDGLLGTGIDPASITVGLSNGVAVPLGAPSYNAGTGDLSFAPQAVLAPGGYAVSVGFSDYAGRAGGVAWGFTVTAATPTVTPTSSATPTQAPSATVTATATPTPSASPTVTASLTSAGSDTASPTASASFTASPTATQSPALSATPTATITPTPSATSIYQWMEDSLSLSECMSCSSSNNSSPSGAFGSSGGAVINPGGASSALGNGGGYLASNGDVDVFQFRIRASDIINAAGLNFLKVTVLSPSGSYYSFDLQLYNPDCSCWNGGSGIYDNAGATFYRDLSSGLDQDFYLRVSSNNGVNTGSPYSVKIEVVTGATISGQVQPLGLSASDASQIQVSAYAAGSSSGNGLSWASTDASGAFNLRVPAGVALGGLSAMRQWYSGGPTDWAYGPTELAFGSTQTLGANGVLSGQNFKVYPEAVLQGTYTGTSNGPSNWNWRLTDEYARNGGGWVNASGSGGSYAVHNALPGTYHLSVDPQDGTNAPVVHDAVVITDGKTTIRNLAFTSGASLSGSISPGGSNLNLMVYEAGFARMNSVAQLSGLTNSYSISKLAPGNYDIEVSGGNGPSPYFSRSNVAISSGANTVNISGTATTGFISGHVTDNLGIGYANLYIMAIIHGSDPSAAVPVLMGLVDGSGNFTAGINSSYGSWDVGLMSMAPGSNWPTFYDSVVGVAPNTSGVALATQVGGYRVSGSLSLAGKPLAAYQNVFGNYGNISAIIFKAGGLRDGVAVNVTASAYASNPLPNGSYAVRVAVPFALPSNQAFTLAGAGSTQDLSLSLDPAKDLWAPSADRLEPVQGQLLVQSQPTLHCRLSDGSLGTGINAGTITVGLSNGSAVSLGAPVYSAPTGDLSFTPQSVLVPGSYTVTVGFNDNAGRAGSASWSFTVTAATPTITPTFSESPTVTVTPSATLAWSPTPSATASTTPVGSPTASPTLSPSATRTSTPSQTASVTRTSTATATGSQTPSATRTATATGTPSQTPSATKTASPTATASPSASPSATPSATRTATGSATPSQTPSATRTATGSATPSQTASATRTTTGSVTPSQSPSATRSATPTATSSATQSPAGTLTHTGTSTETPTETLTSTPSSSPSVTSTATPSSSATGTASPSATRTETGTATPSATPTASPSETRTASPTPTVTLTSTESATLTASPSVTPTGTATGSSTATSTATLTATESATLTATGTATPSATASDTRTASPSATPSATRTETATASPTATASATRTVTGTATPTATESATLTVTGTATPSATASDTRTASPSATPSATRTETATASPTPTATATFTDTPTATPSSTITATFTISPTFTTSPTPVPGFATAKAPDGVEVAANCPRRGEDLCFSYRKPVGRGKLTFYNIMGQRVAELEQDSGNNPCLHTGDMAAGVYYVQSEVTLSDGTRVEKMVKVAIRP